MSAAPYPYKVARQLLTELGIPRLRPGRPPKLNDAQRAQLRERYRASPGQSRRLMQEVGISRATFWRVMKEGSGTAPSPDHSCSISNSKITA